MHPKWLEWARALQAIAQTGIFFAEHFRGSTGKDSAPYHQIERIAAEMIAAGSGEDIVHVSQLLNKMFGIATPQATLGGAIFKDNALLLKRKNNHWILPGQATEFNDTFGQTLTNTIQDETGYRTHASKLIAIYDQQHPPFIHRYILIFQCDIADGSPTPNTQDLAFFTKNEIQTLPTVDLTTTQFAQLFNHNSDPTRFTDFD